MSDTEPHIEILHDGGHVAAVRFEDGEVAITYNARAFHAEDLTAAFDAAAHVGAHRVLDGWLDKDGSQHILLGNGNNLSNGVDHV